uniref:DNA_LIGASE_A3 domain-containing protein n=1 Tax=Meloidogyne hapla TaxID=6305 RepID=A0A1I8BVF8_MELHA
MSLNQQQTVSQKILFNELCNVFQEIKSTQRATKHFIFNKFLKRWRNEMIKENNNYEYRTDDTFYPVLRLFVPSKDIREFRIKESKLNQLVCKSIAAIPLNPVPTNYDLLVERLVNMSSDRFPVNMAKLTIFEINEFLDRIKYPNNVIIQEQTMDKLCRQCTLNELRWIFHIILGNIENYLDIPAHNIMRIFHSEADNLWKEGDSLQIICEKFADPETESSMNLTGHLLCKPFRPMLLKQEINDCVLDCELLIWDNNLESFVGKNRRASDGNIYDPKYLDDDFFENNKIFERSLAVFDILYLNGNCLITEKLPLNERLELLNNIFNEENISTIFISKKELINKSEDFVNFYKNAMSQNEEGIVVKSLNSLYRTGSRAEKNGWFKIKPDYGIQSVLDLAVVGVKIESGQNGNRLKSFLVAARSNNCEESTSYGVGQIKFKLVAGITSRLKALDFQRLRSIIGDTSELLFTKPEWIEEFDDLSKHSLYRFLLYEKIQVN